MNRRGLEEDFGRAAPDHDHAIDRLAEGADIFDHLVGEFALGLALLHMGSVQTLHIELIEDRRHWLDGFEIGLELSQNFGLQHLRVRGRLVDVVFKNVPTGEDHVVQIGQRHKVLDERRLVIGAFAETDGAHLGERTDGLCEPAAHRFNAGDHSGGNGAETYHHYSKLALGGLDSGGLMATCLFS